MNPNTIKLRLAGNDQYFEFEAKRHRLEKDINNAFVRYKQSTGNLSGALHVFHRVHGWNLLTINGVYLIINNPLKLDYDFIDYAISDTMIELNLRPKPKKDLQDKVKTKKVLRKPHLTLVT